MRRIARKRAQGLFDLVAGFAYSQILLAVVESELLEQLAEGPRDTAAIAVAAGLREEAALRLLRAARALDLVEEVAPGRWMLGQQGAVLQANPGAQAMVRHHRLLYADLADPLALLRTDRAHPTALSTFWTYATHSEGTSQSAQPYSELMASSQAMIGQEACTAYDFGRHRAVLDIGGGNGRFATLLAQRSSRLSLGVFDLPEVIAQAAWQLGEAGLANRVALHAGDFFRDPVPGGYDCHTLVRILHDHDDPRAAHLLSASRCALPPGGRLVIVEPMTGVAGAEAVGAYFEMYLWAMGSGRPRTAGEIGAMLKTAGFPRWRRIPSPQPGIASIIVAAL